MAIDSSVDIARHPSGGAGLRLFLLTTALISRNAEKPWHTQKGSPFINPPQFQ